MQQHYQVINLHNIIRSQQSKIQQLRQQLRIANERQQIRYGQFVENNKSILEEKDKMIQFLKLELQKSQKNMTNGIIDERQKYMKDVEKVQKQLIAQKRKCIQLQAKLKRQQFQYQTQLQTLTQTSKTQAQQLTKFQQMKTTFTLQITKLNHFYKNSLFEIGKRKQTLLWVDKFTQYLQNMDTKQKRTLDDISSFVKNQVNGLKNTLAQLVQEIAKNEGQVHVNKNSIYTDMNKIISKIKQQCAAIIAQNQQFWQSSMKNTLKSTQNEQLKALQSQLQTQQQVSAAQIQQLKAIIKSLQAQKKTIILGFQQLRTFNQQKQVNYREEIKFLKKNIEELIQTGTKRDQEFQQQILMLGKQIQNISQRYYENIQYPAKKTNAKLSQDLQQVKLQLSKIQSNSSLQSSVQKIQKLITKDCEKLLQVKQQQPLQKYIQEQSKLMSQILSIVSHDIQNSRQRLANKTFTSRGNNSFQKQFQEMIEEQRVNLRQKYNKSQYQVVLAKKHLSKLKEHYQNLQKKNLANDKKDKKQKSQSYQPTSEKRIQLQAQNQALKENIDLLKMQHKEQVQMILRKSSIKSQSEQLRVNSSQLVRNCITRVQDLHKKIQQNLKLEKQTFQNIMQIKQNTKILKLTLFKPMESLELLSKQILQNGFNGGYSPQNSNLVKKIQQPIIQRTNRSTFSLNDQIKAYKDLLTKKNENSQNTCKLITDLIKTIRDNSVKQTKQKQPSIKKQQDPPFKKNQNLYKNLQKRLRQSQTLRIKDRQEFIQKLQKLQQKMEKISQKINKSLTLKTTLNKFETNLDSKINEIVSKTQIKLDKSQILVLKDDVIADLRSKLNEANHQSQGLRKEMSILYSEKKL